MCTVALAVVVFVVLCPLHVAARGKGNISAALVRKTRDYILKAVAICVMATNLTLASCTRKYTSAFSGISRSC